MKNQIDPRLIEQFIKAAESTTATVEKIKTSPNALKKALQKATQNEDSVLLSNISDIDPGLFQPFRKLPYVITDPVEQQMATVKVGITDAFAGVARTGSICVPVSGTLSGSVSLFTREHIAVLDARTIVPQPRDIFSGDHFSDRTMNQSFVFITGPSATADMGSLVHGVHGPGKLHIIILE